MLRTVFLGLAGFAAALLAAIWLTPGWNGEAAPADHDTTFLAARVGALESALEYERDRRLGLELELFALSEQLNAREAAARSADAAEAAFAEQSGAGSGVSDRELRSAVRERIADRFPGSATAPDAAGRRQLERLIAEGFSPNQAESIQRRTEELRMEALNARYEAARDGRPVDIESGDSALRAELGDTDYERYLRALNRPTSVAVGRVLASSPAEQSGLQPGDQILAYGGERVFSMTDLNRLTLQGAPGQGVVVDVLRDGQPMQVYIPRGPVGIVGGGRTRGR